MDEKNEEIDKMTKPKERKSKMDVGVKQDEKEI